MVNESKRSQLFHGNSGARPTKAAHQNKSRPEGERLWKLLCAMAILATTQEQHLVYSPHTWSSDKVRDSLGNLVFKVKWPTFGSTRILVTDANDRTLLRLCQKFTIWNATWKIYGISKASPMLFKVKESSSKWLNVFVGSNHDGDVPDYKVRRKHATIKLMQGNQVVAKVDEITSCLSVSGYSFTVAPGVDAALVLSLFLIVYDLKQQREVDIPAPN